MTYAHQLSIPIFESVLCLGFSGVGQRLCEVFPMAVCNGEWSQILEFRSLQNFVRDRNNVDQERGETMLRQMLG